MAQINLLQRNTAPVAKSAGFNGVLVYFLFGVVLLEAVLFALLFIGAGSVSKQIDTLKVSIEKEQEAAMKNPDRAKLVSRQGQVKASDDLIAKHTFWSVLVPEISRAMIKTSGLLQFHSEESGEMVMLVSVPNVAELDKFTQAFDLPQFSKYFSDVRITSLNRTSGEIKAEYRIKFAQSLLRPQGSGSVASTSPATIK